MSLLTTLLVTGSALAQTPQTAPPLKVVGSFSMVSDMVRTVGGTRVQVTNLVPVNGDTHSYQPSTGDIRAVAGARLIFQNGAGLENWFDRLRQSAAPSARVVTLTQGLKLRAAEEHAGEDEEHAEAGHGEFDPHAWWDADHAVSYVGRIRDALTQADPAGRTTYANNARTYIAQIQALDAYARKRVAELPKAQRKLVTNHDALGYFAHRYGFTVVGEVFPGRGTEQAPSAQDTARLIRAIKAQGVKAIFTENTVNARLAQSVSRETGARIAPPLYTDALGQPGSAGDTFLKAFRYNVDTIVNALK
nr:zinc ABC transporter substrate-binding protein [Deinococcus peraridilitoris]